MNIKELTKELRKKEGYLNNSRITELEYYSKEDVDQLLDIIDVAEDAEGWSGKKGDRRGDYYFFPAPTLADAVEEYLDAKDGHIAAARKKLRTALKREADYTRRQL